MHACTDNSRACSEVCVCSTPIGIDVGRTVRIQRHLKQEGCVTCASRRVNVAVCMHPRMQREAMSKRVALHIECMCTLGPIRVQSRSVTLINRLHAARIVRAMSTVGADRRRGARGANPHSLGDRWVGAAQHAAATHTSRAHAAMMANTRTDQILRSDQESGCDAHMGNHAYGPLQGAS